MNLINLSIVALSIFASSHFGGIDVKSMTQDNPVYQVETVSVSTSTQPKVAIVPDTVESVVRDYFKDIPALIKVASCESHFHQFNQDGTIVRGDVNKFDVGVMQINEKYHLDRAQAAGINIYTLAGNLQYARDLYNESGTAPWSASQPCWSKL